VGEVLLLPPQSVVDLAEALAGDVDRLLLEVLGAVLGGEDERDRTVGDEAAVEAVVGLDDPGGVLVVLDGDRSAVHLGRRVEAGPLALRDRDRTELLAGGAVLRHVAGRHPGVVAGGPEVAQRLAPVALLLGVRHAAVAVLLRLLGLGPVVDGRDAQDVLRQAAVEEPGGGGGGQAGEGAAAADGEVELGVGDAAEAGEGVAVAGAVATAAGPAQVDGAVDVAGLQAGVGDRQAGRLRGGHPLAHALRGMHLAEADHGDAVAC